MLLYIILFHINFTVFVLTQFTIQKYYKSCNKLLITIFSDKNLVKKLLLFSIKYVFIEEAIFRNIIPNLMFIITNDNNKLITSIIFSSAHIINYIQIKPPIIMVFTQIIYAFFLAYLFLHEVHPLFSLIIHQYNNILSVIVNYFLFNFAFLK